MLFLLSPAKSLDYETPVPLPVREIATTPQFLAESTRLMALLKKKSAADIAALMDLSPALAELNAARYKAWSTRNTDVNSRPAVLAFDGEVYHGLDARTLGFNDLVWAQKHVAILSGLHGVLRPLDRLQPYRLEMGTALANPRGGTLYDFWGDTVAETLSARVVGHKAPVIVNLASQEYFRVAERPALTARVVDCVFEDWKGGEYMVIGFFAKRARGLMARYAITGRLTLPEQLRDFKAGGYAHDPAASTPERLVFRRRVD